MSIRSSRSDIVVTPSVAVASVPDGSCSRAARSIPNGAINVTVSTIISSASIQRSIHLARFT